MDSRSTYAQSVPARQPREMLCRARRSQVYRRGVGRLQIPNHTRDETRGSVQALCADWIGEHDHDHRHGCTHLDGGIRAHRGGIRGGHG